MILFFSVSMVQFKEGIKATSDTARNRDANLARGGGGGQAVRVLFDVPKLAFRPKKEVERATGQARRTFSGSNNRSWHEGIITEAEYTNGSNPTYLSGRLVSFTFKIPEAERPHSVKEALAEFGFPQEASSLDLESESGFRAFDAPNARYRNPLRCCGLSFHMVQFPSTFSEIWVNYININTHFVCWPEEMQRAWTSAGMPQPVITGILVSGPDQLQGVGPF